MQLRQAFVSFILGAVSMLVLVLLVNAAVEPQTELGRFQIIQGTYHHYVFANELAKDPADRRDHVGLFLLDTYTGDAREYYSSNRRAVWGPVILGLTRKDEPQGQSQP